MNILGREFVAEQMPDGWVICERWIDGVLNIIDDELPDRKQAQIKLKHLSDCLEKDCQKLGVNPETFWQHYNSHVLTQLVNHLQ
jgi:hypothetical protein